MGETPFMVKCLLCGRPFQFGPHDFAGRHIPQWDIKVCHGCYSGNWDGVVPGRFPHLVSHLQSMGIEVKLNARGMIEWPDRS
jgi:hypothetical protein